MGPAPGPAARRRHDHRDHRGAFLLAALIGMSFAIAQRLHFRPLRIAIAIYVDVFRAVPVLTQLFIIYFGLTEIGVRLDPCPPPSSASELMAAPI